MQLESLRRGQRLLSRNVLKIQTKFGLFCDLSFLHNKLLKRKYGTHHHHTFIVNKLSKTQLNM